MTDINTVINSHIPDDIENLFGNSEKASAELFYQATLKALNDAAIDVKKMSKGSVTTVHNATAATATSGEIDCSGFSAVLVKVDFVSGTGTWKFDLQGALQSGGVMSNLYDETGTQYTTNNITASGCYVFRGIPDFIKVVATEVADGATITVKIQPINA